MKEAEILLALRIVSELLALVERALRRGEPVTKKDLALAFSRADAAEEEWRQANEEAEDEQ